MRELKATDKITQKMTRDGAVSENLATGEVRTYQQPGAGNGTVRFFGRIRWRCG